MNGACRDFEVLLSAHASGTLDEQDSVRLEAHLSQCPGCRAEAGQLAEVLGMVKLPQLAEAELRAANGLQARILESWSRSQRRRDRWWRIAAGLAVAAVATIFLVPGVMRFPERSDDGAVAVGERWQEPDLDELWAASAGLDGENSADEEVLYAAAEDAGTF